LARRSARSWWCPWFVLIIVTNVWKDGPQDLLRTAKDVSFDMAVIQLEAIDGGPWPFVKEFKETSTVSPQTMERLPDPPRSQVAAVLDAHRLRTAADRERIAETGLAVFRWSLYALVAGIAIAVVGTIMALSYRVERCDGCGHEARVT
jgi:hypothetical protein